MIEFDIDVQLEKEMLKILKGKRKRFIKYLEENNIDVENEEELKEAIEEYKEKENKKIFGINKTLLILTLSSILNNLDSENRVKFKEKIRTELFKSTLLKADKRMKSFFSESNKRTAFYLDEYIKKIRNEKSKAKMEDYEGLIKKNVDINLWEEAKKRAEERIVYSDTILAVNKLGETQAEYGGIIIEELGLKGFVWITKHDSKVREKHAWRDGKIFDRNGKLLKGVAQDSSHILPKQEWGCRCRMGLDEKEIEEALSGAA